MDRRIAVALVVLGALAACSRQETAPAPVDGAPPGAPAEAASASARDPATELMRLAEAFSAETLALNPILATFRGLEEHNDRLAIDIGPDHLATVREMTERYLAAVRELDPERLGEQDRLTWEVFTARLSVDLEDLEYPGELLPINHMFSVPSIMALFGSGQSAQPFRSEAHYEDFMHRMEDLSDWVDQAIANMREGIERGIVQPRIVTTKALAMLEGLIAERPEDTVFWGAIRVMPEDLGDEAAARVTAAYREKVSEVLIPAYRRLTGFMREEYLPASRDTVGWSELPGGEAWYAFAVQASTTTDLDPGAIHRLGLSEVARIRSEMDKVRRQVGFEGSLAEFFDHLKTDPRFQWGDREEILQAYRDLKDRIDSALPKLFSDFPLADYEVRAVEAFREDTDAAGSYQGPPEDNSRPGIFYVNTKIEKAQPTWATETLALHEAAPGHHFQIAIAQELTDLPKIRRFGGFTAYVEGWALYAEFLGPDLGMFQDPYQYFGRLNDEQLRAMRLVVDTGLHATGWSREEAIQYMKDNSALPDEDIVSEVDRYIAWPGQALAYKIGQLTISDLRWQAEQVLEEDFDIRAWHSMILRGGALPMSVLTARNTRWIQAQRTGR
jgi:uncharacterized protein (DUF885 family)